MVVLLPGKALDVVYDNEINLAFVRPAVLPSGREVDGRDLCGARDQAKVRLLSAAVTEAGERTALKASGIFTCARLHAAGTD